MWLALASLSFAVSAPAQTLARPGWVGSGMTAQTWFKHAVFYEIDTRSFARGTKDPDSSGGTLRGIAERLDYIHDLGVDAILLEPLALATAPAGAAPIDPALGSIDDFDELSLEASKRSLRILLTLPEPDAALARFWLTRGVAGFHIPGNANAAAVQAIRKMLPSFVGQRVLITDADLSAGAQAKSATDELQLDSAMLKLPSPAAANTAAELRAALDQSLTQYRSGATLIVSDAVDLPRSASRFAPAGHETEAARLIGAILLLNRSVPVIYAGQELGLASAAGSPVMMPWGNTPMPEPDPPTAADAPLPAPPAPPVNRSAPEQYVPYVKPVKPAAPAKALPPDRASVAGQQLDGSSILSFYRQLIQLHHGKESVKDGEEVLLDYDNANALVFVRKPPHPSLVTPALVVICNPSANPLRLSIKQDLTRLQLRGSFLRSVLHAQPGGVSMNLDPVTLPAFSVYIGDLRY